MASFSQRLGLTPMTKPLQDKDIDQDLRNSLWTVLTVFLWNEYDPGDAYDDRKVQNTRAILTLVRQIYILLFKQPIDVIPEFNPQDFGQQSAYFRLRKIVLTGPWHSVYDLLDFITKNAPPFAKANFFEQLNYTLTLENSAYRIVNKEVAPITEAAEIEAIESAVENGSNGAKEHFKTALSLMSDRKNPDYRNSIKESISAVESVCKVIAGKPSATLNDALIVIKKKKEIHPALEGALIKLYAYTSDEKGIRHALTEAAAKPTYADAKFMLVNCSAFTSYLWTLAAELNLKLS